MPWEQQLCETLDISSDEYFAYYDLVAQHVKEEQGRELIPNVQNEATTIAIVSLVVGLASSAAGFLLAPKPRAVEQQKPGKPFQAQDIRGRTKFSPLAEFDSVQDLATLGSIVPLVYTLRQGDHGGVRVESQLLWSRMRNLPIYQELYALMLFSAGELDNEPEYEGFAFGNNKITSYMSAKLALWFTRGLSAKNGNKPFAIGGGGGKQYREATKSIGSPGQKPFYVYPPNNNPRAAFCGAITPSQSSVFGQYSPIRNGHAWKYDFKWPGKGDGDADKRDLIYGTRRKHVSGYHAGRTTLRGSLNELTYRIQDNNSDKIFQSSDTDRSKPQRTTDFHFDSSGKMIILSVVNERSDLIDDIGGLTEGITAIQQSQIDADTALDIGELYLIGSDIYRCVDRKNDRGVQGTPYEPEKSGSIEYKLRREDEFRKGYGREQDIIVNDSEDIYNEKHIPIQKVTVGSISTTRKTKMVEIGIKSIVYRQIQGYPNISQFTYADIADDYAKEQQSWQPGSITAYYDRISLFRLEIKRGNGSWFDWNGDRLFAVHGNNPQPMYNQINIELPAEDFYEFRFIPVCGNTWIANGYYNSKEVYLMNSRLDLAPGESRNGYKIRVKGQKIRITDKFTMNHKYWQTGEVQKPNTNTNSLLSDFWFFDADTTSHVNEPEHQITWLNEYVENSNEWYQNESKQYEHLAYAGIVCQSSKEISTFSNFSAYFQEGIIVKKFLGANTKAYGATNNFPEIAYDLLTNRRYGVGEFIGTNSVDEVRFNIAAEYCNANGFYWDGVISELTNVREFLFSQAGYQLLDFAILGGQFSLFPSVPIRGDYTIDNDAKAGDSNFRIKALFTDGNIRNFKTTFLSPEERQLFIAELKYRKEEKNGFPETHITRVRLANDQGGYDRDPIEVFDMTQFCTSREHAIKFAKFALRIRQTIDHSVSFETTPDAAHTLAPGDYIRLGVSIQHQERNRGYTQRLRTGSVSPDGTVQFNQGIELPDDEFEVYYWKPGFEGVRTGTLRIVNRVVPDVAMRGILFTRIRTESRARIYKIESIAYTDESFVEIAATYTPLRRGSEKLQVLDWDDSNFVIEDQQG